MTSLTDVSNQTKMILGPIRQAWRWLTKPSDTITTGAERRNAQFLVALLLVNIPFLAIRILVAVRSGSIYTDPAMVVFNLLFLLVCVAYGLSRSRHYKIATTLYIGAFTLALFGVVFIRGEYDSISLTSSLIWLIFPILLSSALLSLRQTLVFVGVNLGTLLLMPVLVSAATFANVLSVFGMLVTLSSVLLVIMWHRDRVEDERRSTLATTNRELTAIKTHLEQRVANRTRDLQIATDVGRQLSKVQELDMLLTKAVDLIRDRFDLYYVQIFLLDPVSQNLILKAGTGTVGKELLRRRHSLPVPSNSINGMAVTEQQSIIVADTETSLIFRPNSLLPDTRSEMAMPLVVGAQVVGVLNLQSDQTNTFNELNLSAFKAMVGQLAVAIENANLFAQLKQVQSLVDEQAQTRTHESWSEFLDSIHYRERFGYFYDNEDIKPISEPMAAATPDGRSFELSIHVSGESIGTIYLESNDEHDLNADDIEMASLVAAQIGQQLDNLRLLAEAERYRADAEKANRQLIREGWKDYQKSKIGKGFVYDLNKVEPLSTDISVDANGKSLTQPVTIQGATIGHLEISDVNLPDGQNTPELVKAVAEQLGAHIENLRLSEQTALALAETQKRTEELAFINDMVTRIGSSLDLTDSMQIVATGLVNTLDVDQVRIALLNDKRDTLTIMAEHYKVADTDKNTLGAQIPVAGVLAQQVLDSRQSIIVSNAEHNPQTAYVYEMLRKSGVETAIIIPMLTANEVIGTVNIDILEADRTLTSDQLRLAETLIFQATSAVQNARLFSQTEEALAEIQTLFDVTTQLNAATSVDEIIQAAVAPALAAGAMSSTLFRFEENVGENPEWGVLVAAAPPGPEIGFRIHLPDTPWQPNQTILINDLLDNDLQSDEQVENNPLFAMGAMDARACIFMGLAVGNRHIGQISIIWNEPRVFTESDRRLYTAIAAQTATAFNNLLLLEETAQRATELQEATEFLDSVIENLPTMLFVKDAEELRLVRWNRASEELTGYKREKMLGKNDYDLNGESADFFVAKDRDVLANKQILEIPEEPLQTVHQGERILHTRKIPILDADGNAKYLLGISEDITERKKAEEALAKQAIELQTVAEVGTTVAANLDVNILLQEVVNLTKTSFNLDHAQIYLLNQSNDALDLVAGSGEVGQRMVAEEHHLPLGDEQSIVARAARSRRGVIINNVQAEADFQPNPLLPDTQSEMAIPMVIGNQLIGVIALQSNEVDRFSPQDINVQTTLATQVATALQNARLYAAAQRQAEREHLVNAISQKIQNATSVESAVKTAIQELGQALQARYTQIELTAADSGDNGDAYINGAPKNN